MLATQLRSYKGYDLYPLVFSRKFERFDGHSRYAEGYDIAIRVCRAGDRSGAGRVFKMDQQQAFVSFGTARRAAYRHGEDIIDGRGEGASVGDL